MKYLKWVAIALMSIGSVAMVAVLINYLFTGSLLISNPVWAGIVCGGLVVTRYTAPLFR